MAYTPTKSAHMNQNTTANISLAVSIVILFLLSCSAYDIGHNKHGEGSTEEILLRHATEFHSTEAGYSGHASHTWGTTGNSANRCKSRPTSLTEPAEACH